MTFWFFFWNQLSASSYPILKLSAWNENWLKECEEHNCILQLPRTLMPVYGACFLLWYRSDLSITCFTYLLDPSADVVGKRCHTWLPQAELSWAIWCSCAWWASAQVVVLSIANIPFSMLRASHQYHQLAMLEQPSHFKYSWAEYSLP